VVFANASSPLPLPLWSWVEGAVVVVSAADEASAIAVVVSGMVAVRAKVVGPDARETSWVGDRCCHWVQTLQRLRSQP